MNGRPSGPKPYFAIPGRFALFDAVGRDSVSERVSGVRYSVVVFRVPWRFGWVWARGGHAQISLALGVYGHVNPTIGKEATDRLDALFAAVSVQVTEDLRPLVPYPPCRPALGAFQDAPGLGRRIPAEGWKSLSDLRYVSLLGYPGVNQSGDRVGRRRDCLQEVA